MHLLLHANAWTYLKQKINPGPALLRPGRDCRPLRGLAPSKGQLVEFFHLPECEANPRPTQAWNISHERQGLADWEIWWGYCTANHSVQEGSPGKTWPQWSSLGHGQSRCSRLWGFSSAEFIMVVQCFFLRTVSILSTGSLCDSSVVCPPCTRPGSRFTKHTQTHI